MAIFNAEECYVVGNERMKTVDGDEFFCKAVWDIVVIDTRARNTRNDF